MSLWKYECPVCQRQVSLTRDHRFRAHGYRRQFGYGNTDYCEGTGQPYLAKEPHDQGQARSDTAGSAPAAPGAPPGDGNGETTEDQEAASGHHRPGQAHDQQGAMTMGTDQQPSEGDHHRPDAKALAEEIYTLMCEMDPPISKEKVRALCLDYALGYHNSREGTPEKVVETAAVFYRYINQGASE